jgi:hypothetical protein
VRNSWERGNGRVVRQADKANRRRGRAATRSLFSLGSDLKGFGIRIAESGTKTYIVRYRPRGAGRAGLSRFMVLGRHGAITPDEARTQAKTILGAVAGGQDPAKERSQANSAMSVAQLVEYFINDHAKPKRKARTAP